MLMMIGRTILLLVAISQSYQSEELATVSEPPISCEFYRGAWCLLSAGESITFRPLPNESRNLWSFSKGYWGGERAYIFEPDTCRKIKADQAITLETKTDYIWQGKVWEKLIISLSTTGQCNLELMYPNKDREVLGFAKSAVKTLVAICFDDQECEANILAGRLPQ